MRPVDRGAAPQIFTNYEDAKPFLTNRLGTYCSFCERRIATGLAVEHILPKDDNLPYTHLRNEWTNFLLGCVNCNSTKTTKVIDFATYLLPDRDNTFLNFNYLETGEVETVAENIVIKAMAQNTLDLVGLNTANEIGLDETILYSALKRSAQRAETWRNAKEIRTDYENGEVNIKAISKLAAASGFFSIWMKVFEGIPQIRLAIIAAFGHTASNCFDMNGDPISPRPVDLALQNSGKV